MEAWFLAPALAILFGLLALAPLGEQVLARGVVFIDLAVAQAAAATALWAGALVEHPSAWLTQALALAGALLCGAIVAWLTRRTAQQREALIGLLYVAGACLALLGARQDPHGRDRLAELLAADLLWAGWPQVMVLAGCVAGVLAVRRLSGRGLQRDAVFFPLFAAVVSLAVPVLGLLVVFACLIVPALWLRAGLPPVLAGGVTAAAAASGLALSWWLDAPSGACVCLAMSACGLASALRSRQAAAV